MFLAVSAVIVSHAADLSCDWQRDQRPTSLLDGKVELAYDGEGKIASLAANSGADDRIVFRGDAMTFAANAAITNSGVLVFKNAITGETSLVCAPFEDDSTISNTTAEVWPKYSSGNRQLVFAGKRLADYEPVYSKGPSGYYNPNKFTPYYIERLKSDSVEEMRFQLHYESTTSSDGLNMKCVWARLRQTDDGIEASIEDGYDFRHLEESALGENGEYLASHKDEWTAVHRTIVGPSDGQKGYALNNLMMKRIANFPEVRFENLVLTAKGGVLRIVAESGVKVRAEGATGIWPRESAPDIVNAGVLEFGNRELLANGAGKVTSSGTLRAWKDEGTSTNSVYFESYLASGSWTQIASGLSLSQLTNVAGKINGSYIADSLKDTQVRMYNYRVVPAGHVATGQIQVATSVLRCLVVAFRHNGVITEMKPIICYNGKNGEELGFDFIKAIDEGSSFESYGVYDSSKKVFKTNIHEFSVMYDSPVPQYVRLNPAAGNFDLADGSSVEVGADDGVGPMAYEIGRTNSLPKNGVLDVFSGGCALLRPQPGIDSVWTKPYANSTCMMRVRAGGTLMTAVNYPWSIGPGQEVDLCGGLLVAGRCFGSHSIADSACYVNCLTLRDGASVTGMPVRVGYTDNAPLWRVRGDTASSCDADVRVVGKKNLVSSKFRLDVWDVTGDASPDFVMNGVLKVYDDDDDLRNVHLLKTGAGTLRLNRACPAEVAFANPTEIRNGVLQLGASGVFAATSPLKLTGGSLEAMANTTNDFGALTLSTNGTITVAAGGRLCFADSSGADWAAGRKQVVVDADLAAGAIRFGENADGLSAAQLRAFKGKDDTRLAFRLDENGYLKSYLRGVIVVIR